MACNVVAEIELTVGRETFLEGASPAHPYCCVFEDDGTTGYFYALDLDQSEQPIVDAVNIYDVANVTDADRPSHVEIGWSDDGMKAVLLINDWPHAVFDFATQRGFCRTGFPPPADWATNDHRWSDSALELFGSDGAA